MFKQNKIYLIYDLTDAHNGYVGWTNNTLAGRLKGHFWLANKGGSYRSSRALRKLNYQVGIRLLETVNENESWQEAEKKWIKHYRDLGWSLWNMTDGGDGTPGWIPSMETRKKISQEKFKQRDVTSKRVKEWHTNNPDIVRGDNNPMRKHPGRMSGKNNPMFGRPGVFLGKKFTREHRQNISKSLIGYRHTEESKQKESANRPTQNPYTYSCCGGAPTSFKYSPFDFELRY